MRDLTALIAVDSGEEAIAIHPLTKAGLEAFLADAETLAEGWIRTTGFKANEGDICLLPSADGGLAAVLIGVGNSAPKRENPWWLAGIVDSLEVGTYRLEGTLTGDCIAAGAFGWCMAQYQFDRYKSKNTTKDRILLLPKKAGIKAVQTEVSATALVRDLVNTPAEDMGPIALEAAARALAGSQSATISVIEGDALLEHNFPTIHAVGRAAEQAPRLIDMLWGNHKHPKVTLVGKGVCFDSGGLDMKSAPFMRNMKKDMGGAAHVLGLAQLIMERKLPVRLRVLVPAVENAVAGNAFRPGDIITTRKGTTVEIDNTDAEGRLVLCDALALADEEEPEILIDFATLTGAARVALGADIPATFANDSVLADALINASMTVGDPLWQMPLWDGYRQQLASDVADISNMSAGSYGGAITAALYLEHFVEKSPRWAHIDTFAWNDQIRPGRSKGGEALGLRAAFHAINGMIDTL